MDDLYDGFGLNDTNHYNDENVINTMNTTVSTSFNDSMRPMTSNLSAGYSSRIKKKSNHSKVNICHSKQKKYDMDENLSEKVELMEKHVNKLLRESIFYSSCGEYDKALNLALKCRKKENETIIFGNKHNLTDNINTDLTFSVLFNLGYIYELKQMYYEALNIYNLILSNNHNNNNKRIIIKVNIGNIYYKQNKYELAIKLYRMSLDEIGNLNYKLKINIIRNICNSFIKLGKFIDAMQSFENIIDENIIEENNNNIQIIFNLIILYYILGDTEKIKKGFIQLLQINTINNNKTNNIYIKQIIQLIGKSINNGYEWLMSIFKKIEIEFDYKKEIISEINLLSNNNNNNKLLINNINNSNNINAFINFLLCKYKESNKYASLSIINNRYNSFSLVNRANCLFIFGEYESAKEMYLEAIGVESDCIEAIYNLGLICKKLGNFDDSLQAFTKLNKNKILYNNNPQIIYQISNLYELLNQYKLSIKWYKVLHSIMPNDYNVLIKLTNLYSILQNEINQTMIFNNHFDSYKLYKCNIDVMSWIGIWYINNSLFENAIKIFKNAYIIQPKQIKWKFMIASCYKRMKNFKKSINIYLHILNNNNNNDNNNNNKQKCLQYLCALMKQINHPQLNKYQIRLQKMQQMEQIQQTEQMQQIQNQQQYDVDQDNNTDNNTDTNNDNWNDFRIADDLLP